MQPGEVISEKKRQKMNHSFNECDVEQAETVKYNSINSRTSPKALFDTVVKLSGQKKDAITALGLSSLLSMTMDGISQKLAYYLVDALDTEKMHIKTHTGTIPVTIKSIHDLLGLPTGGENIIHGEDDPFGRDLVIKWRKQFKKPIVRPANVKKMIIETNTVDLMFKTNWLVLFVNLMCECNTMGSCNVKFLNKMKSEEMLSNVDWCKYLYEKLRTSKLLWKRDNPDCFYAGPVTYLLVHSTYIYINKYE